MTLTPDEVRNTEFRVVLRGYAVHEVDAFLDRVEDELERLRRAPEPPHLVHGGEPVLKAAEVPGAAVTGAREQSEEASSRGVRLLQLAEQTAEQLVAEAHVEAERLVSAAAEEAARRRAEAEAEAAEIVQGARQESDRLLSSARVESTSIRTQLSERYQRESEELERRVGELREEVATLEKLEYGHRGRMVSLLTEQLQIVQREPLRPVRVAT